MHGRSRREGENRRRIIEFGSYWGSQHMRSVSLSGSSNSSADGEASLISNVITNISVDSFCKDGRRISVGDCALFRPPQDSPPFIGIIRCLKFCEGSNLQLGVNWLYRPVGLKLGKGIQLDATPNEIFYSFHKDEIPAASLLHPCKIAFLPKGVELPSGTSSFVCRRVYDIENKCLWWLTDQTYIDEQQDELDRLLKNTRLEIDASFQPGNRSPKPIINSMSTSQNKQVSDNVQGIVASVPSQTKTKKRERGDQSFESVKRERSIKSDDGESGIDKPDNSLRSEIVKMKEKGGLVDSESVEKLIQLLDKVDKKVDLVSSSMLAGIIAATDKFDCLSQFLQLNGLPVFDEWLQDVQKGKIGDVNGLKDGDKSVEDFLLVVLRALDKLPVNLHALQTCHIGRSVNHLRSHKNVEIQKKARSLVDTWKKRVEAEMNATDAKFGSSQSASWSTKSRLSETQGGKNTGGSGDIALKNPAQQLSASKTMSVKILQAENAGKSASLSPGALKSVLSPASVKEGNPRVTTGSASDVPSTTREEKSSSSSQSHNFSQPFSVKDDARSSPVGSTVTNKLSSGSRHRKSVNGFPGTLVSGSQKETGPNKNASTYRNSTQEKFLQSVSTVEKVFEVPVVEGNSNKLIVKIPSRGRSPAQSVSGGSYEDPSIMSSRASSPVLSDKHEGSERNTKEKGDGGKTNVLTDVNAESWHTDDLKDLEAKSDQADASPAVLVEEERSRTVEDTKKVPEVPQPASSSSCDLKSGKLHDTSFSPMNALIESCVKYCEASISMSPADDVGMNLLASVATGEMCKDDLLMPTESPEGQMTPLEELCMVEDAKFKSFPEEGANRKCSQPICGNGDVNDSKPPGSWSKEGTRLRKHPSVDFSGDRKSTSAFSEEMLLATADCTPEMSGKLDDNLVANSLSFSAKVAKDRDGDQIKQPADQKDADMRLILSGTEETEHTVDVPLSTPSMPFENKDVNDQSNNGLVAAQKPGVVSEGKVVSTSGNVKDLDLGNVHIFKVREADEIYGDNCANQSKWGRVDAEANGVASLGYQNASDLCSDAIDPKTDCSNSTAEKRDVAVPRSFGSRVQKNSPTFPSQDVVGNMDLRESHKSDNEAHGRDDQEYTVSVANPLTASSAPKMDLKINFDLNEGLVVDDVNYGEVVNSGTSGCLSTVQVVNLLSSASAAATVSSSIPVSITVAAAAKGPFVPPVDLLRSKGELGWKGSAATSAFRPAEPRKALQLPLGSSNISLSDDSASKPCRPALDIDLNVPDERVLEDLACRDSSAEIGSVLGHLRNQDVLRSEFTGSVSGRSSGGLDFDLNRVDDANDILQFSASNSRRPEAPVVPLRLSSSSSLPSSEVRRDFDLNNGPSFEDVAAEQSLFAHHGRGNTHSVHTQPAFTGPKLNNLESGHFSACFSPGTFRSISTPSPLPDRGEQPFSIIPSVGPQRMLGPVSGNPFASDVFRGPVLTSSPAVPFTPSPFAYQMFPFGTTLPLPSTSFSVGSTSFMGDTTGGRIFTTPVNTQFLGPVSAVSSQFPRPYMVSLSDGNNNGGVENNGKWSRQGLDLNTGPGVLDIEGREETVAPRQLVVGGSHALAEEQARMFPLSGVVLKRKEPDGGLDSESMRYKQSSWSVSR